MELSEFLGGPVFELERRRLVRKPIFLILLIITLLLMLGWLIAVHASWPKFTRNYYDNFPGPRIPNFPGFIHPDSTPQAVARDHQRTILSHLAKNSVQFFQGIAALFLLLTPALVAGAIGNEKEKDTLLALLGTELSEKEILLGKLAARVWFLCYFLLSTLPIPLLIAGLTDVPWTAVLIAYGLLVVEIIAVAALTICCSIFTRSTREAILGCYSFIIVMFLILIIFFGESRWFRMIDPIHTPSQFIEFPDSTIAKSNVYIHLIFWLSVGMVSWIVSNQSIRHACFRQLEAKPPRRLHFRIPMGDTHPIFWRECHILGIAPVEMLRKLPTALGVFGVFVFSMSLLYFSCLDIYGSRFNGWFLRGEWDKFFHYQPDKMFSAITLHGAVLLLVGVVTVATRASQCISEEIRRKTWNDLVLTPMTMYEIVYQKRLGLCWSITPHMIAYILPMFILGYIAGGAGLMGVSLIGLIVWMVLCGIITLSTPIEHYRAILPQGNFGKG